MTGHMKQLFVNVLNPWTYLLFVLFVTCISLTAQAQKSVQEGKPILVHNNDTTYVVYNNTLNEVKVVARRNHNTSLSDVIKTGKITTSVNGLTKDLQRDLPSTIRFYTAQGIPILTNYTSNNSLTSSFPDSAVTLDLREPSAKFPNPDAPIILQANYGQKGNIFLSPLTQTMNAGTGTEQAVSANFALSHSGPPGAITNQVPELNAYSTTFSGFGAVQAKTSGTETELMIHHSQSANEYGNLLNVQKFYEDNHNSTISLSHAISLGSSTIDAGIIAQNGREFRQVTETNTSQEVVNDIKAMTYTAGLSNRTTELRANFHDYTRIYSWPVDTVRQQRLESILTHEHTITDNIEVTLESRFDFKDLEPSFSGNVDIRASRNLSFKLNGGRLYDAVGSEGLNSLMSSVQISPSPWIVTYGSVGANLKFNSITFNTSLMHKTLERGWYGLSADISGWVGRVGANGFLFWADKNNSYLKWSYEGVARELSLDLPTHDLQAMPGPATFEQHISLEAGIGNMTYAVQLDSFINRYARIDMDMTANLGPQHFLSFDASRRMGAVTLGLSLYNLLALTGTDNYFSAHLNQNKNVELRTGPPFL